MSEPTIEEIRAWVETEIYLGDKYRRTAWDDDRRILTAIRDRLSAPPSSGPSTAGPSEGPSVTMGDIRFVLNNGLRCFEAERIAQFLSSIGVTVKEK
jgi:hypothetical protein